MLALWYVVLYFCYCLLDLCSRIGCLVLLFYVLYIVLDSWNVYWISGSVYWIRIVVYWIAGIVYWVSGMCIGLLCVYWVSNILYYFCVLHVRSGMWYWIVGMCGLNV